MEEETKNYKIANYRKLKSSKLHVIVMSGSVDNSGF